VVDVRKVANVNVAIFVVDLRKVTKFNAANLQMIKLYYIRTSTTKIVRLNFVTFLLFCSVLTGTFVCLCLIFSSSVCEASLSNAILQVLCNVK
jgi:hypothetical protein